MEAAAIFKKIEKSPYLGHSFSSEDEVRQGNTHHRCSVTCEISPWLVRCEAASKFNT